MSMKHTAFVCAAVVALTLAATTAQAVTIFSQTPNLNGGRISDKYFPYQMADDVTLATTATARSVTWRGFFGSYNTPTYPVSFDLIFYGTDSSRPLPDRTNVLSSTTVTYTSVDDFTKTGNTRNTYDEYEFEANINPTLISAGTRVWFSVLADTQNDDDDVFYWTIGDDGGFLGYSSGLSSSDLFFPTRVGPLYFVLSDTVIPSPAGPIASAVPEPASMTLAMLGLGGLALSTRRRRQRTA